MLLLEKNLIELKYLRKTANTFTAATHAATKIWVQKKKRLTSMPVKRMFMGFPESRSVSLTRHSRE